jgi:23S rRNA pseudouridine2605 synthase
MQQRLQKILSAAGVASRRRAETLITEGRVTVNGRVAAIGESADPETDRIEVDGERVSLRTERLYLMMNKPRGYVTTVRDDKGRKTVMDLLPPLPDRVYPIGRLDLNSEGLLLFTNDGAFADFLMHPSNEKTKTYHVRVAGALQGAAERLSRPMVIDGYKIAPAKVRLLKQESDTALFSITIHEGRNRQVRRMCEACSLRVLSLKRVEIGGVRLGNLSKGAVRHLTADELQLLRQGMQVHRPKTASDA